MALPGFRGRRGKGKRGKSASAPGQLKKVAGVQSARTFTKGYKRSAENDQGENRPARIPGKVPAVKPPAKAPEAAKPVSTASTAKPATAPAHPANYGQLVSAWAKGGHAGPKPTKPNQGGSIASFIGKKFGRKGG